MPVSPGSPIVPLGQPIGAKSGGYTILGVTSSTSATLGNGTLRAAPVYVPTRVTLDRIGADITSAGEAGSKVRLGIYNDNGNLYPGALLLDAGQINGDSATVQEIAISQVLEPGVYWLAGAVQSAPTTQPTVRTATEYPFAMISASNVDINADGTGVSQGSVTGALPATFTTSISRVNAQPRIFVRAA